MHHRATAAVVAVLAPAVACLAAYPTPAAGAGSAHLDRMEGKVVRLINGVRAAHGLPRVRVSRALERSAAHHSRDMLRNDFFAHTSSNGRSMGRRVLRYRPSRQVGENIAYLQRGGARRVVGMWMRSPGHRAMILHAPFRRIGVGVRGGILSGMRALVFTANFATRR